MTQEQFNTKYDNAVLAAQNNNFDDLDVIELTELSENNVNEFCSFYINTPNKINDGITTLEECLNKMS